MAIGVLAALPLVLKVIDAAKTFIPAGSAALGQFRELEQRVQAMKASGREPTAEEFHQLQEETNRLTDRLENANRRLNPGG